MSSHFVLLASPYLVPVNVALIYIVNGRLFSHHIRWFSHVVNWPYFLKKLGSNQFSTQRNQSCHSSDPETYFVLFCIKRPMKILIERQNRIKYVSQTGFKLLWPSSNTSRRTTKKLQYTRKIYEEVQVWWYCTVIWIWNTKYIRRFWKEIDCKIAVLKSPF